MDNSKKDKKKPGNKKPGGRWKVILQIIRDVLDIVVGKKE